MPFQLRARHISALAHLCVLPFIEADELVAVSCTPHSSLHRVLGELKASGLARRVPHSFDGARRTYRWIPTSHGVRALSDPSMAPEREMSRAGRTVGDWIPLARLSGPEGILDSGHATAHWHRILSRRLDILACVYRLLGSICKVEGSRPAEFRLYRGLPHDAAVRMPSGECYGVIVRRPAFEGSHFRRRFAAGREYSLGLTATFIVAPAQEDLRTIARETRPLYWTATAIGPVGDLRSPDARCWMEPDNPDGRISLRRAVTAWRGQGRLPNEAPARRRRPPDEGLQMPPHLSRTASGILHAIADWPLSKPCTVGAITATTSPWLKKQLGQLRGYGLVRSVRVDGVNRLALTDEGIALVSMASRTNVHENRKRWSSRRGRDGTFVGGMMRQLVREIRHNDMAHRLVSEFHRMSRECSTHEVLAAVPPHRGMKFFHRAGRTFSIRPDATMVTRTSGQRHILLMELERRAVFPKAMETRMAPYLRYFETAEVSRDYDVEPKVMVVLENPDIERRFQESQEAADVPQLPIFTGNEKDLERFGPFGKVWRRVGDQNAGRVEFSRF